MTVLFILGRKFDRFFKLLYYFIIIMCNSTLYYYILTSWL